QLHVALNHLVELERRAHGEVGDPRHSCPAVVGRALEGGELDVVAFELPPRLDERTGGGGGRGGDAGGGDAGDGEVAADARGAGGDVVEAATGKRVQLRLRTDDAADHR